MLERVTTKKLRLGKLIRGARAREQSIGLRLEECNGFVDIRERGIATNEVSCSGLRVEAVNVCPSRTADEFPVLILLSPCTGFGGKRAGLNSAIRIPPLPHSIFSWLHCRRSLGPLCFGFGVLAYCSGVWKPAEEWLATLVSITTVILL